MTFSLSKPIFSGLNLRLYHIHKVVRNEGTVTLTFDPCPAKCNQFICESDWTFAQSLKKIPQRVTEIWQIQQWTDVQTDKQPENIMSPRQEQPQPKG